ncbi:peptidoglycan bridge formation glycyltransferase FemA/FemB family protein [Candidatus Gracilibacteria bacterium]|nr:peptidoglycan bridge formation glycyltransferase FemA/FemB family protein [Candidatus Gracilibacteria bacterium]
MKVFQISDSDSHGIEKFLKEQKFLPIQQTPIWAKFQKSVGVNSIRIGVKNEVNELVVFVQIFVRKLPFGFTSLQISRAPLLQETGNRKQETEISDLLISEIEKIAREKNAVFARFDFQEDLEINSPKFREVEEENFPLNTLVLDLTKSEEEILAQMKPKGRYNIRVAVKHGVDVREMNSQEGVEIFCKLLTKTTSRDGFSAHPKNYYQKFIEQLGEHASLLIAKKEGIPLAAVLLTFSGDTATYYFGASDYKYRNLMAPYLLQLEAIKMAKTRSCKCYDFLGIAPEDSPHHRLTGVSDFKKKFGGKIIKYPKPRELVLRSLFYKLFKFAKKFRS